jgi:hypothetical protein
MAVTVTKYKDLSLTCHLLYLLHILMLRQASSTGQFKKKVTLSHVYNEVTSEPTTIVRKTLKVCL